MTGFFWNVRGLNKTSKHSIIQNWVRQNNFSFGCLLETKVKESKAAVLGTKLFADWSMVSNYEFNRLGRIWVIWKHEILLTPIFKSGQVITCLIKLPNQSEFFCSFIYASNFVEERKELWRDLRIHHHSLISQNKSWICMGDFNEILDLEEHSGFDMNPSLSLGTRDFQEVMQECSFDDLHYHGPIFTWCNRRDEGPIYKKLDRVIKNDQWSLDYPRSYAVFEAGGCSDHLRGRIHLQDNIMKKKLPFKFNNSLIQLDDFQPLVENYWSSTPPIFSSTSSLFMLSKKLKNLKPHLRDLTRAKLGNLTRKAKERHEQLCDLQIRNFQNPSQDNMNAEREASLCWEKISALEEIFLKQKSKLHWLKIGDQNNKLFLKSAETRKALNTIREVKCRDGRQVSTDEDIKVEAESFFREFLQHSPQDFEGISVEALKDLLPNRCSEGDGVALTRDITSEEIKDVLFSMPSNKSPGPDGYNVEFFKDLWSIIGSDFIAAVKSFFEKGFLPKGLNSTIIALVPKKSAAQEMKDYRPISCCNVIYKVISKLMGNRLKGILPDLISLNQLAFVKDRLIIENILLATDLVKDYHKDSISSRCAIKIDLAKAFDSVQWQFLLSTLTAMNFPPKFVHWISLCITSPSFSVQVNGELVGYFQSKRGLRQGCSLSPLLFVIAMNVLTKLLDKAARDRRIGYHPKCKIIGLTHLSFADDIIVFSDGTMRSIEGILDVFGNFAKISGLRISLEKSTIFLAGTPPQTQQALLQSFSFTVGQLPIRYLGVPLLSRKLTTTDCIPLFERIKKRITSWTTRFLSTAGRLQLINSVLLSISNYWLSAFRLPKACINDIKKLLSAFLWSGPSLNPKKTKVSWDIFYRTRAEGGLGLRRLSDMNNVGCLKILWRLISDKPSMWVQWVQSNLLRGNSFWSIPVTTSRGSWMWKKLLKLRPIASNFHKIEVNNGLSTHFWYDCWSSFGSLIDRLGPRGVIDLGIPLNSTVASVLLNRRRRRRHRVEVLEQIEDELEILRSKIQPSVTDTHLWKMKGINFRSSFSTKHTLNLIRCEVFKVPWFPGIWFTHSTPKFSMLVWLAIHRRLKTGDQMATWNVGAIVSCALCGSLLETQQHLFSNCDYSASVWKGMARGLLTNRFTRDWHQLLQLIVEKKTDHISLFLIRYVLQATVYYIWQERNGRRHGDPPTPAAILVKQLDKQVQNRCSTISDPKLQGSLQQWFSSRIP